MSHHKTARSEQDEAWKTVLTSHFQHFMHLLFSSIAQRIDWAQPVEFLDKELQKIQRRGRTGKRLADKLVKVAYNSGEEIWLLIHVEVQGRRDDQFAERMFIYYARIRDLYGKNVSSLAVLADTDESFRPASFQLETPGCQLQFSYAMAKLLDYRHRIDELEASDNPFAIVILTQLQAKLTEGKSRKRLQQRLIWKKRIARLLYHKGWDGDDIRLLFSIMDYMITLPETLEADYEGYIDAMDEDSGMALISNRERKAEQRGIGIGETKGEANTLLALAKLKFGPLPEWAEHRILEADKAQLDRWVLKILDANSLNELLEG